MNVWMRAFSVRLMLNWTSLASGCGLLMLHSTCHSFLSWEDFNFENNILIDGLVYECKEVAFTFVLAYRN